MSRLQANGSFNAQLLAKRCALGGSDLCSAPHSNADFWEQVLVWTVLLEIVPLGAEDWAFLNFEAARLP
jgi:hypothetical protein